MKTYVFRVVVEPDDDRWVAYSPALKAKGGRYLGLYQRGSIGEYPTSSPADSGEPDETISLHGKCAPPLSHRPD